MEQVLEAALRRKPKPLQAEPAKIIEGDDAARPEPAAPRAPDDVPAREQPPVVVERH